MTDLDEALAEAERGESYWRAQKESALAALAAQGTPQPSDARQVPAVPSTLPSPRAAVEAAMKDAYEEGAREENVGMRAVQALATGAHAGDSRYLVETPRYVLETPPTP